jgi:hypothetical protein
MEIAVPVKFLNRRSAAKYVHDVHGLRCSEKWLAKLAVTGGGPVYFKDGRAVLYRHDELDAWVGRRVTGPWKSSSHRDLKQAQEKLPSSDLRSGQSIPLKPWSRICIHPMKTDT